MSGICLPIDADGTGVPAFPAAQQRVADAVFAYPVAGRALGARPGVRPGAAPALSLTGSNWTLTPFSFEADTGSALAVGPYRGAFLANETGTLNPADGSNPRIDRLDVQVPDEPPPASGALRIATIVYTPGLAASSPLPPAAPVRSFPLGTFNVPAATTGSPSWAAAPQLTVAAGGILPVSASAYGNGLYVGQYLDDPTLGLLRWDGTTWRGLGVGGAYDATWTAVPATSGWTSALFVRKRFGHIEFSGNIQKDTGTIGNTAAVQIGSLPGPGTKYVPKALVRSLQFGYLTGSGPQAGAFIEIASGASAINMTWNQVGNFSAVYFDGLSFPALND